MAKQTMEGRRFAKRQFAVCAGLYGREQRR